MTCNIDKIIPNLQTPKPFGSMVLPIQRGRIRYPPSQLLNNDSKKVQAIIVMRMVMQGENEENYKLRQ